VHLDRFGTQSTHRENGNGSKVSTVTRPAFEAALERFPYSRFDRRIFHVEHEEAARAI